MYLCTENKFAKKLCLCKMSEETLEHLFTCKIYIDDPQEISFDKVYNGSVKEQYKILQIMKVIFDRRKENISV